MELSIVIPIYNAERYLRECLNSVMSNPQKEMECILVNDGSDDNSFTICRYYAEADSRFKLIDKKNGGASSARNAGIAAATGKYIMFLDADDYMEKMVWKDINDCIKKQYYDFVAYSYYTLHKNNEVEEESYAISGKECTNLAQIRSILLTSSKLNTCWGKLFNLDKILEHNIRFRTDLKIGEDFIFVADYFTYCNSALLINQSVLYCRQHSLNAMVMIDLDTRLNDTDILFQYNKAAVLAQDNAKLLNDMYVYYLKTITKLFLVLCKRVKFKNLIMEYKKTLQREVINEIVTTVEFSKLPVYKKLEGSLLKNKRYRLLAGYFKLKSCLMTS